MFTTALVALTTVNVRRPLPELTESAVIEPALPVMANEDWPPGNRVGSSVIVKFGVQTLTGVGVGVGLAAVTVITATLWTPFGAVAVIVAVPTETPVIFPDWLTVATLVFLDAQTNGVAGIICPFSSLAIACICEVVPACIVSELGVISTEVTMPAKSKDDKLIKKSDLILKRKLKINIIKYFSKSLSIKSRNFINTIIIKIVWIS